MSRTYRARFDYATHAWGRYWVGDDKEKEFGKDWWKIAMGWRGVYLLNRRARDEKPWYKPDKTFKRMKRQGERAKVRDAMSQGREIPVFPKSDRWDWT